MFYFDTEIKNDHIAYKEYISCTIVIIQKNGVTESQSFRAKITKTSDQTKCLK